MTPLRYTAKFEGRDHILPSGNLGIRGGLSSCRAGEYSGFMTDGDDVYDILPLKNTNASEGEQGSLQYHLIRKTRGAAIQ